MYANNLTITTQGKIFEKMDDNHNVALNTIEEYYNNNYLKPNQIKRQITVFH